MKMERSLILICAIVALVWAVPATAMPIAKPGDVGVSNTVMVWGHGHHYGWGRGHGHHYGWSRGRHHGWHRA